MLNFLRSRGDSIASYNPVNYFPDFNKKWPDYKFKKPFILVDFRYHPAADWWFDHHLTSFLKESWQKNFVPDQTHVFNPKTKSVCELVLRHLADNFKYKPPRHMKYLVEWASIIDGATYKSPKELVEIKEPAIKFNLFIDAMDQGRPNYARSVQKIIEALSAKSLAGIIKTKEFKNKISSLIKNHAKKVKILKLILQKNKKVVFADLTGHEIFSHKFVIYYLYPEIFYSVGISRASDYYHLGVGKNPWNKTGRVNIGQLLTGYGGGGHRDVGGVERKSKEEIIKIADEITEYLNEHG